MVLQVDQQCGIGGALVDQPSLENRVQVGAARRLHQSPPRHIVAEHDAVDRARKGNQSDERSIA